MSRIELAFRGALSDLTDEQRRRLFDRATDQAAGVRDAVRAIVHRVRTGGDRALLALARELDGVELAALEVPAAQCRRALDRLGVETRRAMERAARNLETTHRAWMPAATLVVPEPGVTLVRRPDPIGRVGVYAPGGRAAYPSSVLMAAVPARVAGVGEIVLASPPGPSGRPGDLVLGAAALAGVDRVFAIAGAGAVAALAFGTESVPRVDRLVGPGNAYVMEAKLQVAHLVGIDGPAGPSEVLVLADTTARPDLVAREMVAQAEHDPRAAAVAVLAGGAPEPAAVEQWLERLAAAAGREDVIRESLAARGGVVTAGTINEAVTFANRYAAEHVLVAVTDPDRIAARLRNAGAIFVGAASSVTFGDYLTGANHVLPTGGLARAYSGLGPEAFTRWTSLQRVSDQGAAGLAGDVAALAQAESLPGHAEAARAAGRLS